MPISTMLSGKLISIGTSFFVVLGSGHYDLDQNVQGQDIAVPATTQITSAMPVDSVQVQLLQVQNLQHQQRQPMRKINKQMLLR